MDATGPADLLRSWFDDVWNAGRLERADEILAADGVVHGLDETGAAGVGPAGFRPFFVRIKAAMPDIRFTIHHVVEAGDHAVGRLTATATHSGEQLGVRATGNVIHITGMVMVRVQGGMIVEAWNEWDRLAMAVGIGAVVPAV
jgi:predicted ester cyclase